MSSVVISEMWSAQGMVASYIRYTDSKCNCGRIHLAWRVWVISCRKLGQEIPTCCPCSEATLKVLICLVPTYTSQTILLTMYFNLSHLGCRITCSQSPSGGYTWQQYHCVSQLAYTSPSGRWARHWQTHHEEACINITRAHWTTRSREREPHTQAFPFPLLPNPAWADQHTIQHPLCQAGLNLCRRSDKYWLLIICSYSNF